MDSPALHLPTNPVRFVTAASLFDGHDASIAEWLRLGVGPWFTMSDLP